MIIYTYYKTHIGFQNQKFLWNQRAAVHFVNNVQKQRLHQATERHHNITKIVIHVRYDTLSISTDKCSKKLNLNNDKNQQKYNLVPIKHAKNIIRWSSWYATRCATMLPELTTGVVVWLDWPLSLLTLSALCYWPLCISSPFFQLSYS